MKSIKIPAILIFIFLFHTAAYQLDIVLAGAWEDALRDLKAVNVKCKGWEIADNFFRFTEICHDIRNRQMQSI